MTETDPKFCSSYLFQQALQSSSLLNLMMIIGGSGKELSMPCQNITRTISAFTVFKTIPTNLCSYATLD
jgi:hypothetical protein